MHHSRPDLPSSSSVGSIAKQPVFRQLPAPSYKISKAALNMMTMLYSQELADEGFAVFCVSPGVSPWPWSGRWGLTRSSG